MIFFPVTRSEQLRVCCLSRLFKSRVVVVLHLDNSRAPLSRLVRGTLLLSACGHWWSSEMCGADLCRRLFRVTPRLVPAAFVTYSDLCLSYPVLFQVKLKEVLREHFARHEAAGKSTRAIVFTQFRDSVEVCSGSNANLRILRPRFPFPPVLSSAFPP